jgi:hypothetical protein
MGVMLLALSFLLARPSILRRKPAVVQSQSSQLLDCGVDILRPDPPREGKGRRSFSFVVGGPDAKELHQEAAVIAVAVGLSLVAHQAVHFWRRRVVFAATTPPDSSFISEHLTVCVSSSAGSVPPSNNRPNTSFAPKPVRGGVALAPTGRRRR